ncbi:hypothetical protein QAD02_015584 [Eretmocerus hayati]|uniref:Uncharacterized protein n=1 Tax=Eretmocerus hayati TaxID=131215 RepID=A0ACC2PBG1_9HYME|nr:hypothetical protein QAD02_015584 [Eretmocerus hayati]
MACGSNKLQTCEVCAAERAKYTCPKCEVRTCGLQCSNIHKKELNCDGIRDKTKFIPINAFTDLDLLSDYRLLEDIGRSVEQFRRDPCKRFTRCGDLPSHLFKLRGAAFKRGTRLEFMPQNFSRHKDNSTYFDWKTNEFFWRVELIFPQADNAKWVVERVIDTKRLSTLFEEIFNPSPLEMKTEDSNNLIALQNKLKFYNGCGITGLRSLLKAERVEKSDSRFYELDFTCSLQENFKNKIIIEFPIIYVILKDHSQMFEIIDSDDEDIETQSTNSWKKRKMDHGNRKQPTEHVDVKKPKVDIDPANNFFFNSEASDSEHEEEKSNRQVSRELSIPDYNELVKM